MGEAGEPPEPMACELTLVDRTFRLAQRGKPRPVRLAMISAQIDTAVSSGVRAADVEPDGRP